MRTRKAFRMVVKGDRLTVRVNGEEVVHNGAMENCRERGKPLPATGPTELPQLGNPLEFESTCIK